MIRTAPGKRRRTKNSRDYATHVGILNDELVLQTFLETLDVLDGKRQGNYSVLVIHMSQAGRNKQLKKRRSA
ncbi:hypothetical protein PITCH_A680008 [uncultured Desulfobacterium sp.]|uniref:Uncharacterized protein n=1 Tax=uncultured Desulfobacterium sp. TaxID=201089 RepID=A0A445N1M9_9BACT|nr:hypothetical protein PITCH_A680008 [uncultured Desulfobacterium sp.]